jgi:hypothetical protein
LLRHELAIHIRIESGSFDHSGHVIEARRAAYAFKISDAREKRGSKRNAYFSVFPQKRVSGGWSGVSTPAAG